MKGLQWLGSAHKLVDPRKVWILGNHITKYTQQYLLWSLMKKIMVYGVATVQLRPLYNWDVPLKEKQ